MVPGHPFKGGPGRYSVGQLLHPELKKFGLLTPHLFLPTRPGTNPRDTPVAPVENTQTASDLLSQYFGNAF